MLRISGEKVQRLIAKNRTTASKLAAKADRHRDTIYDIIKAGAAGSWRQEHVAQAIADALGVTVDKLLVEEQAVKQIAADIGERSADATIEGVSTTEEDVARGAVPTALMRRQRWREWLYSIDFTPLLAELRKDFVGRTWLFDRVKAWMRSGSERVLSINGSDGVGKSAFLAELIARNPLKNIVAYHFCTGEIPVTEKPGAFVRSIAAMLAASLPSYGTKLQSRAVMEYLSGDYCRRDAHSAFEQGILAALHTLSEPKDGARYLVVDNVESCASVPSLDRSIVRLIGWHLDRFPHWLKIILTSTDTHQSLNELLITIDERSEANCADLRAYLAMRFAQPRMQEVLARSDESAQELLAAVVQKSDKQFRRAKWIIDGLESGEYECGRPEQWPAP